MGKENQTDTGELKTIREIAEKNGIPAEVYEGVKAAEGWKEGRLMTESDFLTAVGQFRTAPADGRDKEANG